MKATKEERDKLRHARDLLRIQYDVLRFGLSEVLKDWDVDPSLIIESKILDTLVLYGHQLDTAIEKLYAGGYVRRRRNVEPKAKKKKEVVQ